MGSMPWGWAWLEILNKLHWGQQCDLPTKKTIFDYIDSYTFRNDGGENPVVFSLLCSLVAPHFRKDMGKLELNQRTATKRVETGDHATCPSWGYSASIQWITRCPRVQWSFYYKYILKLPGRSSFQGGGKEVKVDKS